jgi:hypothetical protein
LGRLWKASSTISSWRNKTRVAEVVIREFLEREGYWPPSPQDPRFSTGGWNMAIYYYTPFRCTDENERRTWNMCLHQGAKFANAKEPLADPQPRDGRKYLTPEELATRLLADDLPNKALNLVLMCCYGAGPQQHEIEKNALLAGTPQPTGRGLPSKSAEKPLPKDVVVSLRELVDQPESTDRDTKIKRVIRQKIDAVKEAPSRMENVEEDPISAQTYGGMSIAKSLAIHLGINVLAG